MLRLYWAVPDHTGWHMLNIAFVKKSR